MIDGIEPLPIVKRFSLLVKIELQIAVDKIIIESKLGYEDHETILKQAYDLKNWLTTTRKTDNAVQIVLLPNFYPKAIVSKMIKMTTTKRNSIISMTYKFHSF